MSWISLLQSARSIFAFERTKKPRRSSRAAKRGLPTRLNVERLDERVVLSTFSVLNLADNGAGSLRAAITAANTNPGVDVINFAPGLRGTIGLTSGELVITDGVTIDGPGAGRLAVSGNDASRVLRIGSGAEVTIDDLTVSNGRAVGQGGGILNAGSLTLSRAIVSNNQAVGRAGATLGAVVDAFGGGIFNAGTLTVGHTIFVHNQAIGADGTTSSIGSSGLGGAIMSNGTPSAPATATVSYSAFTGNEAIGGAAGIGASRAGVGGAINNATGTLTVSHSVFHDNQAVGGLENGVPGGFGAGIGGAISNVARFGSALLSVSYCTLTNNRAVGGAAGAGTIAQNGRGGAIANYVFGGVVPPVIVTAIASIDHSKIVGNQAIGGVGPTGGNGLGGGIENENGGVLFVSSSLIAFNQAIGGDGDNGGTGLGGGIFSGSSGPAGAPKLTLSSSIVALNQADGGAAAGGSAGEGLGGGLYLGLDSIASADLTVILANDASTSDDDVFGLLV